MDFLENNCESKLVAHPTKLKIGSNSRSMSQSAPCKLPCKIIRRIWWISAILVFGIFIFFTPLGDPKVICAKQYEVADETGLVYIVPCVSYKYIVKAVEESKDKITKAVSFSSTIFIQALNDSKSKGICIPSTGEDMDLRCFQT